MKKTTLYTKSIISLFASFISIIPAQAATFSDVHSNDWFAAYVNQLASIGIISTSNTSFYPQRNLTRAELAKMAVLAAQNKGLLPAYSPTTAKPFCDVAVNDWANYFVNMLKDKGIVGVTAPCTQGRNFLPNQPVTRAEALKILFKVFNIEPSGQSHFGDVERTAWYSSFINTATTMHIVNGYGDGTFRPNGFLTRAEMSKVIFFLLNPQATPPANTTPPTQAATNTHQITITSSQGESALRDAINHAQPGDEILLTAGVYQLSRQLWIDKQGTADHPIIIRSKDGPYTAKITGSPEEGINIGDGASFITLDGLEAYAMGDNIIHIQNAHHITVQNVKAHDAGHDGDVIKVNQAHHISILNNELARSGNRPGCPGENCWQELIDFVNVNDSTIQGNTMSDFGNLAGYVKGGSSNVSISSNTITGQRNGAVDPAWGIGGWTDSELIAGQYEANNITFTNNTISNNSYGALGIYDAEKVNIHDNQFLNNHGSLIEFRAGNGPAAKSDTISISSNIFTGNQTTDNSICHLLNHGLTNLNIGTNTGNNSNLLSATSCTR